MSRKFDRLKEDSTEEKKVKENASGLRSATQHGSTALKSAGAIKVSSWAVEEPNCWTKCAALRPTIPMYGVIRAPPTRATPPRRSASYSLVRWATRLPRVSAMFSWSRAPTTLTGATCHIWKLCSFMAAAAHAPVVTYEYLHMGTPAQVRRAAYDSDGA